MKDNNWNHLDAIEKYESGSASTEEIIELFQYLVDTGLAWLLQGSYGRTANRMIEEGLISD